jgi:hypothetical protein
VSSPRQITAEIVNGGYNWCGNEIHRLLVDAFPTKGFQQIAVYNALCFLASIASKGRHQVAAFEASFNKIAHNASCCRNSAIQWLNDLEAAGFIEIDRAPQSSNNLTPNRYTLVSAAGVINFQRLKKQDGEG